MGGVGDSLGDPGGRINMRRLAPGLLAALVMTAMFAVGVASGIAIDHRLLHPRPPRAFGRGDGGRPSFVPGATIRGPGQRAGSRGPLPERAFDQFARDLALTPVQRAAVDSVMRHQFTEANAVREAMWPRMRAVVDETRHKVDSLLTPEQRDRYHVLLAEQERRMEDGRRAFRRSGPP